MAYINIAIYAVPKNNKEAFKSHSEKTSPIFKKYGALSVIDCWGVDIPDGHVTSMPMAVKCEDNEIVAYSHIMWPSKEVHDEAMPKAMQEMQEMPAGSMPFDGKRMIFGGFEILHEL